MVESKNGESAHDAQSAHDERNEHKTQTVTALVENKPGVLARVVGLFARRGFNIMSLAVAPTQDNRFSRITFVYDADSTPVDQVLSQVNKLIHVLSIEALDGQDSVERELLVATVTCAPHLRGEILELLQIYEGRVLDVGHSAITVSVGAAPADLDHFAMLLSRYGIVAMQRSGRIALRKLKATETYDV